MVVANKMDLPESEDRLAEFRDATGLDPLRVSAASGEGIDALKQAIHELYLQEISGSQPQHHRMTS
jgi:50S ribosomal subunit-associated GTPase HflX